MQAYFVRGCEDNAYRIFSCRIEISGNYADIHVGQPKFKFGQNDGEFRFCNHFTIYFNTTHPNGLFTYFNTINIRGITKVGEDTFFDDGYVFYQTRESIPGSSELEMGN